MQLPHSFEILLTPLFETLPPHQAMAKLCPTSGADPALRHLVESLLRNPPVAASRPLHAGLWLYIDELDRSHEISQDITDATGSYWHGIMHRREGDFSNSHYWFNRAGKHPAMALLPDYDGHALVDAAAAAHPSDSPEVVRRQRDEWMNLFAWCAARS